MFAWRRYAFSIVATVFCILLEAMVACGLAALDNTGDKELKKKAEDGDENAKKLLNLKDRVEQSHNFTLLVMTTINLAIGFLYSRRISYWSLFVASKYGNQMTHQWFRRGFEVCGMLLLIYFVVLCAIALPRRLALKKSEVKAMRFYKIINGLLILFQVFSLVIEGSVRIIFKITGRNPKEYADNVTEDEIISIVNEGLEQGILENNEVEMIANIIEMDEKEVRDIMTRRTKIVALEGNLTVEEAMKIMLEKSYSRFPVYEGDIDNIIGIVFWKDITKYYIQNHDKQAALKDIAKKAYLVPDTKKIDILFEEMQMKKIHMAIAVDEYGQTAGIVAMEDVLEEIVGNIFDEFDVDERMIIKQREGKYFMRGMAPLDEVAEELHINMDEELEDFDTLNGFLISKLGHIPNEKEKVNIMYKGYEFHAVDIKDKTFRFVRVHRDKG